MRMRRVDFTCETQDVNNDLTSKLKSMQLETDEEKHSLVSTHTILFSTLRGSEHENISKIAIKI